MLLEALARGAIRRVGLGLGQRPLLPLPRRHRASTPPSSPRSSGAPRSSATPATRCSCSPPSRRGSATTTTAGRASRCACRPARTPRAAGRRRRLLRHLPQHEPLHLPRHPPARTSLPAPTSTPAWPWCRSARSSFTTIVGLGLSALASGDHLRNSRAVDYRTDLEAALRRGLRPVPVPGRRRLPRRGVDASSSATSPACCHSSRRDTGSGGALSRNLCSSPVGQPPSERFAIGLRSRGAVDEYRDGALLVGTAALVLDGVAATLARRGRRRARW